MNVVPDFGSYAARHPRKGTLIEGMKSRSDMIHRNIGYARIIQEHWRRVGWRFQRQGHHITHRGGGCWTCARCCRGSHVAVHSVWWIHLPWEELRALYPRRSSGMALTTWVLEPYFLLRKKHYDKNQTTFYRRGRENRKQSPLHETAISAVEWEGVCF